MYKYQQGLNLFFTRAPHKATLGFSGNPLAEDLDIWIVRKGGVSRRARLALVFGASPWELC
jgi:hypothetical protein